MPEYTVAEIAERVGGEIVGETGRTIRGVASLDAAREHDLSFVANRKYLPYVGRSGAAAFLVSRDLVPGLPESLTAIVVSDAHVALGRVVELLHPPAAHVPGVHATAVVADEVELADDVSIGAFAVIGRGSVVGAGARIDAHVVVGENCRIGAGSRLHPHVTLYDGVVLGQRCVVHSGARLGADGFGYAWLDGGHRRIPQVGGCRLEDDVEIGANTTIDRGSVGETAVARGTKIDNLVHLGHNVRVGTHVIVVAQTGVAGSSTIGDGAVLGGQVGVGGHLDVGAGARVAARSGVIGDVAAGETVSGYPARPHREAMRASAALFRLPQLLRRLQKIEEALFGEREPGAPVTETQNQRQLNGG